MNNSADSRCDISRKPKVLFLEFPLFSLFVGGGQYFMHRVINTLTDKFNIVIASPYREFYKGISSANVKVLKEDRLEGLLERINNKIYTLKNRTLLVILTAIPALLLHLVVSRKISKEAHDANVIILTDGYYQGEINCLLSKVKKKNLLQILLSASPLEVNGIPFFYAASQSILREVSNKNNLNFIALNSEITKSFNNIFPGKCVYIPNAVEAARYFPLPWNNRNDLILYVGRLDEKQKNISLLIRAFSELKENRGYTLQIAGSGNDEETYKKLIEELGMSDSIKLLGDISEENKIRLLSSAKIFVNPSVREGQSSAVLEAMSTGCAVVCVENFGTMDTIENNFDGIISRNDISELRSTIERLIGDEELMQFLGKNARQKVLNLFSLEKVGQKYSEILTSLAQR